MIIIFQAACGSRHLWRISAVAVGCLLLMSACGGPRADLEPTATPVVSDIGPSQPPQQPWFDDVTAASGVSFTYRNGEEANHYAILESLGGGVAVLDFNADGILDLFIPGGGWFEGQEILGYASKLYQGLGDCKFRDVTASAGLKDTLFYSHGAAVGDYDRDGWPDLAVTGWGPLALFHNESDGAGGRRFVHCSAAAGLEESLWSSSAAWADLNGDGWSDIYVCQYGDWSFKHKHPLDCFYAPPHRDVCPPRRFKALPHKVYRNSSTGSFMDASSDLRLRTDGKGLGVVIADLNSDAKPDIYVTNDTDPNFLYINRSSPGKFELEERGLAAGVARDDRGTPNGSMGTDAGDFDRTGRASLFCTNYENELQALYRNRSSSNGEFFQYCTQQTGLAAIGQSWVSWGTGFADFQHRGWEDIVIVNGHAIRHPTDKSARRQRPLLMQNVNGFFTSVGDVGGNYFKEARNSRGLALADLDNDGDLDFVVSHLNEPISILKNVNTSGNHWLGLALTGKGHRDIVGTSVTVQAGGKSFTRFVKGGGSYASSSDRRLVFGLGQAITIEKVLLNWSWGETQVMEPMNVDRYWQIIEDESEPRLVEFARE